MGCQTTSDLESQQTTIFLENLKLANYYSHVFINIYKMKMLYIILENW